MKRFARISAYVAGTLLLLLIGAAAALRFLLPPEKARALIEKQLESRLGREVQLGQLSISGISTFRVKGIQVSEVPTFKSGTFLTADSFAVSARLLPLLFRRVMVKEIILNRPKLTIVRNADGSFNGMDAPASVAAPASAAASGSSGPTGKPSDLTISDIRLNAGSVTFVDHSTSALSAVLDPIDVHLSHVSLVSPVALDGTATAGFRGLTTKMSFKAGFDPLKGDATLDRLTIEANAASAEVTGHVKNLFGGSPEFNGTLTWKGLNPSSFTALAPLPDGLSVKGPTTGRLEVSGTAPSAESRFEADMSAADVRWKDLVHKQPGVALNAKMALDRNKAGDLKLHDLLIKLASVELSGEGTLKGSSETAHVASFRVETNQFDIADLFRYVHADLPGGVYLSGPVKATVSMDGWTGGGRFVADFDGTGLTARYGEKFQKAPGTALRLVADGRYAEPLAVDFSSVRLDLDQLSMSGKGSYTNGKERPTYVFRVKTNVFPLKSIAALLPVAEPYHPNGQAVVNMRVSRGVDGPIIGGDATLLAAGATIQNSVVSDLAGALDFTNDSVTTAKLTGKIQGDALQMSLHASRLLSDRPLIEADIRAARLDLAKLLPPDAPKKTQLPERWRPFSVSVAEAAEPASPPFIFDTKGSLRATTLTHPDYSGQDLVFEWDLKAVTADMDRITGKAKLRHGRGQAKNLRSLMASSKAAKLILGPLGLLQKIDTASGGVLKIPSLENFDFTSISGDYNIKDGVATLAPMVVDAPILNSHAEGTVGLAGAAPPVNLRIVLNIQADQLQGVLGQALAAAVGGGMQTIRMTMTGTVADPKVSVDQQALKEKAKDVIKNIDFQSLGKSILKGLQK